jgi:TonB family protein
VAEKPERATDKPDSPALEDLRTGRYDALFRGAPDKPADLYRAAQIRPPVPTVKLLNSLPVQPEDPVLPQYPPLARLARIEGKVIFKAEVDSAGNTTNFTLVGGHPMLVGSVKQAVTGWKFPTESAGKQIEGTIEFATNCAAKPH